MKKHALLSASGASRWMTCTPSARLEESQKQSESEYADEGTLAHEISEWRIKEVAWGVDCSRQINKLKKHRLYSEEMYQYCTEFAEFVVQKVRDAKHGAILVQEERYDLSKYIPEGFGTTDANIVGDDWLEIVDLKYGKGVPIDAFENKQLMVYALGALEEYELLYNIVNVRMTIYQPRIDNISSYEITADNLKRWGHEVLRPAALAAFQGIGDFIPGKHCQFCRVKATCKAHAQQNLQIAARDFNPPTLTDEQVVKILAKASQIKNWLNSVEDYALKQAVHNGRKWPGLKLVEGRATRKCADEEGLEKALLELGLSKEEFGNYKLKGITELTKLLGKKKFSEVVEPFLVKPPGKPTLVNEDDPRPQWNSAEGAALDFEPVEDDE